LELLEKDDPSPAKVYFEAGLAAVAAVQIILNTQDEQLGERTIIKEPPDNVDRYADLGITWLRASLEADSANFQARYWLYQLVNVKSSGGLGSIFSNLELRVEKTDLLDTFAKVTFLEDFVEWTKCLFGLADLEGTNWGHKRDFRKAIAGIDLDKLQVGRSNEAEKQSLFSEAGKLQRRAKVELNA
jgi:hypothetical protein